MQHEPVHRKYHHNQLTFGLLYAWTRELRAAALPRRGRPRQGLARSARCPATTGSGSPTCGCSTRFMWAYPGKKLLFMGGEFGQSREWNHDRSLDWHLLEAGPYHRGAPAAGRDLNRVYRARAALHEVDFEPAGFEWMDCTDWEQSVVAFCRFARGPGAARGLRVQLHARSPARATGSACRARATTARCSTPTARATAAATSATRGGVVERAGRPGTASRTRWPDPPAPGRALALPA